MRKFHWKKLCASTLACIMLVTGIPASAFAQTETLKEVENVIEKVQRNVGEITNQVEENTQKLAKQNEYFGRVFRGMEDMTRLLYVSVNAINTMGEAHTKQGVVIGNTVTINQDIVADIQNINEQFAAINSMVESNVSDIAEMTSHIASINGMVDKMNHIFNEVK